MKKIMAISLLLGFSFLYGCGQTGPLYLPSATAKMTAIPAQYVAL
jgi:predicted small lipoprotein YifL